MSEQTKLRIAGLLMLAAFPLYGGGQAILLSANWPLGLALVLANSVGVILIGFLMRCVIADTSPRTAVAYLAGRIAEGVLLAIGGLSVVSTSIDWGLSSEDYYHLGMTSLGLVSLTMCMWLVASRRVANFIGWFGFIGYLCLVAAMVAADRGFGELSLYLLIPGAIFELIFGVLLVMGRVKSAEVAGQPVRT